MAPHLDTSNTKSLGNSTAPNTDRVARRKLMKHNVEKRRRNKMNGLLEEMKSLVLQGMNKDPAQFEKMEKADILDMTLQYLLSTTKGRGHQRQGRGQRPMIHVPVPITPRVPPVVPNYGVGYHVCLAETKRFLQTAAVATDVTSRLMGHLEVSMSTRGDRSAQSTAHSFSAVTPISQELQKQLQVSIPKDPTVRANTSKGPLQKVPETFLSLQRTTTDSVTPNRYVITKPGDVDINNNVVGPQVAPLRVISPQWRPW